MKNLIRLRNNLGNLRPICQKAGVTPASPAPTPRRN